MRVVNKNASRTTSRGHQILLQMVLVSQKAGTRKSKRWRKWSSMRVRRPLRTSTRGRNRRRRRKVIRILVKETTTKSGVRRNRRLLRRRRHLRALASGDTYGSLELGDEVRKVVVHLVGLDVDLACASTGDPLTTTLLGLHGAERAGGRKAKGAALAKRAIKCTTPSTHSSSPCRRRIRAVRLHAAGSGRGRRALCGS